MYKSAWRHIIVSFRRHDIPNGKLCRKLLYYLHMVQFAKATKAPQPRNQSVTWVSMTYVAILVIMAVAQLFGFEDFIPLIQSYDLPGGFGTATLVGCLIVYIEIFALPFLLRMPLSPPMRWMSLVCGLLVPLAWIKLTIAGLSSNAAVTNSGLLGAKVTVHGGTAELVVSLILLVLAVWSVWGLWPVRKK